VDGFDGEDLWQEHPSIFAASDNALYVAWEGRDRDNDRQQIKLTKSVDGGQTWSQWKNVRPTEGRTQSRPSIVEGNDGTLYLFMYSSVGNSVQQIMYASSSDRGETWSDWRAISDPAMDSRHVSAATDKDGRVWASWRSGAEKKNSPPAGIYFSVLENGVWSKPSPVSASSFFQFFPSVGTDADGAVRVAWMESPDASDFPREHPESGELRTASWIPAEKRFAAARDEGDGTYPGLPLQDRRDGMSLLYSRTDNDKKNGVHIWLSRLER
jgi:hypothetical protein